DNIHDLDVHDNFTDTTDLVNRGVNTPVTNTTVVPDGNWPAAALQVMNSAGVPSQPPTSLFTTQAPAREDVATRAARELGTQFQSSVGGVITAVRYYKAPGE